MYKQQMFRAGAHSYFEMLLHFINISVKIYYHLVYLTSGSDNQQKHQSHTYVIRDNIYIVQ